MNGHFQPIPSRSIPNHPKAVLSLVSQLSSLKYMRTSHGASLISFSNVFLLCVLLADIVNHIHVFLNPTSHLLHAYNWCT